MTPHGSHDDLFYERVGPSATFDGDSPMTESLAMPSTLSSFSEVSEAVNAVANSPETISNVFDLGGRLVYGTVYAAAFAVTFPVALLIAVIPKGTALSRGLIDGSSDAINRAESLLGRA